jgi:hypothetical protein
MNRIAFALLLTLAGIARAADAPDGSAPSSAPGAGAAAAGAPAEGPTKVAIGYHIFDIRNVDLKAQSFYADFYMWMRYIPKDETQKALIEKKWEFMNGKAESKPEEAIVDEADDAAGQRYVCWRMSGTFNFKAYLRNYPFDTQTLEIAIEHATLETGDVLFMDDTDSYKKSAIPDSLWGVKEDLDIPEFSLRRTDRRTTESVYKTDFGDPRNTKGTSSYSRFVVSIKFSRDFMPYFFKIIIPLIVIVAMAYLVFFLPPKEIQTASGLAITALLSCIAFNVSVSQNLPEVGYLVVSDKFFICTYILLFLTLLQCVMTYVWHDVGRTEFAEKWDKICRIVFPILYVAAFSYLLGQALMTV